MLGLGDLKVPAARLGALCFVERTWDESAMGSEGVSGVRSMRVVAFC